MNTERWMEGHRFSMTGKECLFGEMIDYRHNSFIYRSGAILVGFLEPLHDDYIVQIDCRRECSCPVSWECACGCSPKSDMIIYHVGTGIVYKKGVVVPSTLECLSVLTEAVPVAAKLFFLAIGPPSVPSKTYSPICSQRRKWESWARSNKKLAKIAVDVTGSCGFGKVPWFHSISMSWGRNIIPFNDRYGWCRELPQPAGWHDRMWDIHWTPPVDVE